MTSLISMWALVVSIVVYLRTSGSKEINKFDPFELLKVAEEATTSQIKKAYRRLSIVYHPDKNPDDPLAASHFIQITKAYAALTDEAARRNWEKFGNPDGPQTTNFGIGLPRLLLRKDLSLHILCAFFFVIVVVVPVAFICYFGKAKNYAANGVLIESLQFLGFAISETTGLDACPELLAACAECRSIALRPTDNQQVQALAGHVVEHKRRSFILPVVMKNQYLIWAHMQRRHALLSPELASDLDTILGHAMKITQVMIEIACMREHFSVAKAAISFRRSLLQALDICSSEMLQVPHFTEELAALCVEAIDEADGEGRPSSLAALLKLGADCRKALLEERLNPAQLVDVEAFCSHVGQAELFAAVEVEDEAEVVVGDIATAHLVLCRRHLSDCEAMGPVHAPHFPEPKFEEWWLFLVEENGGHQRIIHYERTFETGRLIESQLRFQVTRPGQNVLTIYALCDAYAGLDLRKRLTFHAFAEDEHVREYVVHEEDLALEAQPPSVFQQWMGRQGGRGAGGEEDEDDDDEDSE